MKSQHLAILAVSIFISASIACAAQTDCPEDFAGGQAPEIVNQKLIAKTREVCYTGYALKHSGITRTPLYSAEHLTRERLQQGRGLKRQGKFHPEENIPRAERAELRHYARSGYDRGHMAPSGDMFDLQSQWETFSLANMVPQDSENNRGSWEGVEAAVRKLARKRGELYVVSGPIFKGENVQRIGGAVMVPTQIFKAVYDPIRQEAGAYLIDNVAGAQATNLSIAELEKLTGMIVFPAITDQVKAATMHLPEPRAYKERKRAGDL